MIYRSTKSSTGRNFVSEEDVMAAVEESPGASYRDIARRLDVCMTTIRRHMRILIAQGKVEVRRAPDSSHMYLVYSNIYDAAEDATMRAVRAFFARASPYARNPGQVVTYTESVAVVRIIQHRGLFTLNVLCEGESRSKTLSFDLCVDGVRRLHGGMPLPMMGLKRTEAPEGTVIYSKDMSIVTEVSI